MNYSLINKNLLNLWLPLWFICMVWLVKANSFYSLFHSPFWFYHFRHLRFFILSRFTVFPPWTLTLHFPPRNPQGFGVRNSGASSQLPSRLTSSTGTHRLRQRSRRSAVWPSSSTRSSFKTSEKWQVCNSFKMPRPCLIDFMFLLILNFSYKALRLWLGSKTVFLIRAEFQMPGASEKE